MPLVEKRYAEALIGISEKNGEIDAYQEDLQEITSLFNQDEEFRFFLLNPEIAVSSKKAVVEKLWEGAIRKEVLNFLKLILDKDRVKYLPGILEEYIRLADKRKNILSITIFSAAPLEPMQIEKIKAKYKQLYNASDVKVETKVDETLVGGIRVQAGDKVVDGTIKGRLASLKDILVKS
ncbi:MAG: F0F1 ATP synthase subunit delta [Clostridiales bacterium]|jgi:F-type H+-transporting ATPase subunit delta|nr:F0F1 ATP synthase subunit delta [Eubacteriales bacterium]MDH7566309.1 F0F1 ATP synthase subunit delta [Clostridiales bacterium]